MIVDAEVKRTVHCICALHCTKKGAAVQAFPCA